MLAGDFKSGFSTIAAVTLIIVSVLGFGTPASAATAGSWTTPTVVSSGTSDIGDTQILSDSQGNLTALWVENVGSIYVLKSASQPSGGSWSSAVTISPSGKNVDSAKLVIDDSGNLTAVWRTSENPNYTLQSATKPLGGSWSGPVNITPVGQTISGTSLVVDGSGGITAAWSIFDGTGWQLQSATKANGASWSSPTNVSVRDSNVSLPELVVDSSGAVTAVWDQYNSTFWSIKTASRSSGGTWSAPQDLSAVGISSYSPQIVIDGSGKVTALWTANSNSSTVVQSSSRPVGGTWTTFAVEAGLVSNFGLMEVVSDSLGNLTVLGGYSSGLNTILRSSSKPVGGQWSSSVALSDPSKSADWAHLVIDQSGNVTAVWQWGPGFGPGQKVLQSATRSSGGSWSTTSNVSAQSSQTVYPSLWMGESGQILASWQFTSGSTKQVQYSTMAWQYLLSYEANVGSGPVPPQQSAAGGVSTTVAAPSTLTRSGFTFAGWNTRADGSGTAYAAGASISLIADTTLYAQWTPALAATGSPINFVQATLGGAGILLGIAILLTLRRRARS